MPPIRYKNSRDHCRRAKELCKRATRAEQLLWNASRVQVKNQGLTFRRQHPIAPYIADFACIKARVIIEVDGFSHGARPAYDTRRSAYLQHRGWKILRFSKEDVAENLDGVVTSIQEEVRKCLHVLP